MIMDPYYPELSELVNGFRYYDSSYLPNSDQYPDIGPSIPFTSGLDQNPNFSSDLCNDNKAPSSNSGMTHDSSASSPDDATGSSDQVLKYINQILMEEKFDERPCMLYDPLALQQTEEMLNLVIAGADRTQYTGNSIDFGAGSGSWDSGFASSSTDADNFVDSRLVRDPSVESHYEYNLKLPSLDRVNDGVLESSMNDYLIKNMFSDTESVLQFQKGLEEASKFLPSGNQLNLDLFNSGTDKNLSSGRSEQGARSVRVKEESEWLRGRKNHEREKTDLEEARSSKQAAVHVEDCELSEMFDSVLLLGEKYKPEIESGGSSNSVDEKSSKKQGKKNKKTKKKKNRTVDFRTLLILCAQAVSAGDKLTANELLKQIRQQSSPLGDGSQRVAHCFANALEARLARTSCAEIQDYYNSVTVNKTTAAHVLKAYQVYLTATPFTSFIYSLAMKTILDAAENAKVLHIVDFGILYGFQWPMLIKMMSKREGGPPPKLRITGIELPQHGFRTTERIEETGRRLAKYAERFGVPFEYNPIASKNWGTIRMEELKIRRNEILVVNSMHRFKNLHDETAYEEGNNNYCTRDAVLRLIREMNPDLFIYSIINGSYNAPFFLTRFKEALFHFSALFDVFDNTLPRDNEERLRFERLFHGREVMNVIASEGTERVERPETYRQWQVRTVRAGFKQVPVNRKMIGKFREDLKLGYHKDFVIDEDGDWFLQGWKGRILYATSCWVPA